METTESTFKPETSTQEPIFPSELKLAQRESQHYVGKQIEWFIPCSLEELLQLKYGVIIRYTNFIVS